MRREHGRRKRVDDRGRRKDGGEWRKEEREGERKGGRRKE